MIPREDFLGSVWFRGFDLITAFLSILGTLYIIIYCRRLQSLSVSMKMIRGIAIADMIFAIANIMSHFHEETIKNDNLTRLSHKYSSMDTEPKNFSIRLCQLEAHLRNISFFFSLIFTVGVAIVSSPYGFNRTWLSRERIIKSLTRIGIIPCIMVSIS